MLYLILLLPVALAVCCCVLRPDGGRARSAVLLAVQGAELLLVLLAVCRGAELVSPVWHMSEALTFSLRLDRLAGFFCLLTAACWLLTMVYALRYMTHEERQPRFYVFFFLTETMVLGTALAARLRHALSLLRDDDTSVVPARAACAERPGGARRVEVSLLLRRGRVSRPVRDRRARVPMSRSALYRAVRSPRPRTGGCWRLRSA